MWSAWIFQTPLALEGDFPCTSGPEPIVFLGLIAVIPTSDDLPEKTLEVVGAFTIRGILHSIVCSELLQHEVREAVDVVKDPKRYQRLHHVRIELRQADIQIQ